MVGTQDDLYVHTIYLFIYLKMPAFWVVALPRLVELYRLFRGACCLHHQNMMEAASTSETSVKFYNTTRRNNPEGSHLYTRRRENLKSHICLFISADKFIILYMIV
jgi:hypothetical protein